MLNLDALVESAHNAVAGCGTVDREFRKLFPGALSVQSVFVSERSRNGGTKTLAVQNTDLGAELQTLVIVSADGEVKYKGGDWVKAKGVYTQL